MKKSLVLAVASLCSIAGAAAHAESFGDRARVLSSTPVYERIPVSREECWNDRQRGYEERRVTRTDTGAAIGPGTVLGAVVGGVIGHQFGSSSGGRDRGTAAGAIVGGLVGNQVDRDRDGNPQTVEVERVPVERNVERCRTVNEVREATLGYDVRYEYAGKQFTTRLPRDPGRFLRVRVDLEPEFVDEPRGPRPPSYR
ncbi:MAG: glycine zipper 2TM domain-containing protein [Usitatibacter sp.]